MEIKEVQPREREFEVSLTETELIILTAVLGVVCLEDLTNYIKPLQLSSEKQERTIDYFKKAAGSLYAEMYNKIVK